jgi:hypothetical protein
VRDGDLVAVGSQPTRHRQPDPSVTSSDEHRPGNERRLDCVGFAGGIGGFFSGYVSHLDNLSLHRGGAEIARRCQMAASAERPVTSPVLAQSVRRLATRRRSSSRIRSAIAG